jgi:uncharacterized protein YfiM (DUF2279 family)
LAIGPSADSAKKFYIIANILAAGKQLGQNQQIKASLSVAV